jgi:DNA repair protein RecN (Recombination protein N)
VLKELRVRDFAVLAEALVRPGPGLNAFTGETGAGKSLLVEALGFLMGERGSVEWIRSGASRLEVRGVFESADLPASMRKALGLAAGEFALRRELDASGRSKAFIGDSAISASRLSEVGEVLADFHGQHEHQTLLKPALQMDLLDGFGELRPLRERAAGAFAALKALRGEIEALSISEEERERRLEMRSFQAREISEADPQPGEDERLEAELPRLKNASKLMELSDHACEVLLRQEGSAEETASKAARLLADMARIDPSLGEAAGSLDRALECIRDAAGRVAAYREGMGENPGRIDDVLLRLDKLSRLKKKYGPTLADVAGFRDKALGEIASLGRREERRAELERACGSADRDLRALCEELHDGRIRAARELSSRAAAELGDLGMPGARFSVSVEYDENSASPAGADSVEFLIAPNPGEPLKPLRAIASGGEMSRVMLALKSVLARQDRVSLLVFDEVDSGVGGTTARAVGRKLGQIGRARQVLCVTHLPQVACFSADHFEVSKSVSGGRTVARVERLDGDGRVESLARMLGGRKVTEAGLRHARELMESP